MGYRDRENTYSLAQALTASAASSDKINHGSDRNLGIGEPMCVVVTCDVAADHATNDEAYAVKLQTDSDEAFGGAVDVGEAITISHDAVAGDRWTIPLPPDGTLKQYTRLYYTLGGTTPTITLTAALVPMSQIDTPAALKLYPDGI